MAWSNGSNPDPASAPSTGPYIAPGSSRPTELDRVAFGHILFPQRDIHFEARDEPAATYVVGWEDLWIVRSGVVIVVVQHRHDTPGHRALNSKRSYGSRAAR